MKSPLATSVRGRRERGEEQPDAGWVGSEDVADALSEPPHLGLEHLVAVRRAVETPRYEKTGRRVVGVETEVG